MSALFQPVRLGALHLKHRVVMAPLTRMRSLQPGDIPHALNAVYYGQRASEGGLIISEATDTSGHARGYPGAPGIYTQEQTEGWKLVTAAVHAKGGLMVSQIWHTGRMSHSSMQPDGLPPFAPSAIAPAGGHIDRNGNPVPFETPRAMTLGDIARLKEDFRLSATNAKAAGFDGVEVHGANGYLLDQFLQDKSNRRDDQYGGSIENRARLLLEIVDLVSEVVGADRVGVRIAPWGIYGDIGDSDPVALFSHVARELGRRNIAYLHIVEPRADQNSDTNALNAAAPDASATLKALFGGAVISAGGFTQDTAEAAVSKGTADAVAFGRLFLANPDLPERFRRKAALNHYHRPSFYGGDERGYIDYPFLEMASA